MLRISARGQYRQSGTGFRMMRSNAEDGECQLCMRKVDAIYVEVEEMEPFSGDETTREGDAAIIYVEVE
ncbi:hypothetical protein E4U39_000655 [Claviceps sp. Clav50 group G5]|nr:hypothetical protein E4U39_000655 [Claviceps sp. Clav50 group G5]